MTTQVGGRISLSGNEIRFMALDGASGIVPTCAHVVTSTNGTGHEEMAEQRDRIELLRRSGGRMDARASGIHVGQKGRLFTEVEVDC